MRRLLAVRLPPLAAGIVVALGLLFAGPPALAQGDAEVPYLTQRVTDLADMLNESTEERLEGRLEAFEQEVGSQVAVLTVPDLDGEPIEDYSIRVVESWQLGREGIDDGVLFLISRDDRRMRIEVGYGLEGVLTDATSRRILDNVVAPRFRDGDFGGGIEAGVEAILAVIRGEELPAPTTQGPSPLSFGCVLLLMLGFLLFVTLLSRYAARHSGRGRGWSSRRGGWVLGPGSFGGAGRGGFGGGGFGGFSGGGGGFGGGGASSGW